MSPSFENFATVFNRERMLQSELEKIEIVSIKLINEYKDYQDLVAFIDYLRSSEEIFAMSKSGNWTGEKLKEELIKNELRIASLNAGLDENIFGMIYDNFRKLAKNVDAIYTTAEELLKKYGNDPSCAQFINYLRDISVMFIEVEKEGVDFDEAKERLFKIKMQTISADGKTEISKLEEIYNKFKLEISSAKKH